MNKSEPNIDGQRVVFVVFVPLDVIFQGDVARLRKMSGMESVAILFRSEDDDANDDTNNDIIAL